MDASIQSILLQDNNGVEDDRDLMELSCGLGASGAGRNNNNGGTERDNEKNVESLQEIFRCFICMENLRDARMCPRCSKLCCNGCIRRWLTETRPQCPHCRGSLHVHELVKCRWAEEVTQQLDNLNLQNPKKNETETERCETHVKEELSVYCQSCQCCICHECALWSPKHADHKFKPLDEIYLQHCEQVRDKVVRLRGRLMELIGGIREMEKNIEAVRNAKDQKVRETRNAVELMIARLDSQLKTKLVTLVTHKSAVTHKAEQLEEIMRDVENVIANGPKSELIAQSQRLLQMIEEGINQSDFSVSPVSADFQSELVPPYECSTYVIENYGQRRERGEPFFSDPLSTNGLTWRLKIYPDGNGVVRGQFLSVFLELSGGPSSPQKYEYRIEMIYQHSDDPSKNMVREFASDFEVNECWGYNRFFRIELLEHEGFHDPITDTIKLKFEVRNPTYYLKCRDQQWYIAGLERKLTEQNQTITDLTQRLLENPEGDTPMLDATGANESTAEVDGGPNSSANVEMQMETGSEQLPQPRRVQKIQLLDLTDNNDTEETVSEPDDSENENELEEEEEEDGATRGGEGRENME